MRRLKESLVSNALKLQVASKVVECDDRTIQFLRRDLEEARKSLSISLQKESAANELVQALKLEVIQLKRRLREDQEAHQHSHTVATSSLALVHQEADNQVNKMMHSRGIVLNINEGNETSLLAHEKNKPTHFQEWKMNKFLWTPDAPAGSYNRDDQVVEELLQATLAPTESGVLKTNKITVAKRRPGTTSKMNSGSSQRMNRSGLLPGLNIPSHSDQYSGDYQSSQNQHHTLSPSPIRNPGAGGSGYRSKR